MPNQNIKNSKEISWEENFLNFYENYSYNLKLYMISERDELTIQNSDNIDNLLENSQKIIIAETGSTAFNIRNLRIESVVSPNNYTGYMLAKTFEIEIFEPTGFSFYDKLISSAFVLGIKDLLRFPVYLEITFKGYDENGNIKEIGDFYQGNFSGKWVFKILITDVDVSYDNKGSSYRLIAVPYADIGKTDSYSVLGINLNIKAKSVKEVFDAFIKAKEKEEIDHYNRKRNIYRYKINPIPSDSPKEILDLLEKKTNPMTWNLFSGSSDVVNRKRSSSDITKKDFSFPKGHHIEKIVKEVFSNTNEGQRLVMKTKDPIKQEVFSEFSLVWIVDTDVKIREDVPYDYSVRDYNKIITYIITPYITTNGVLSRKQLISLEKGDSSKQEEKLLKRARTGRLVKKYDYFYTGLNTDIIEATLNFDHLYKAIISVYGGLNSEFLSETHEIEQDIYLPRYAEENDIFNQLTRYEKMYENIKQAVINSKEKRLPESLIDREIFLRQKVTKLSEDAFRLIDTNLERKRKEIIRESGLGKKNTLYLEDIEPSIVPLNRIVAPVIDRSVREDPVSFRGSIEPENPIFTSITLSLLNQIASKAMMEIDLKIKGDPYWLGLPSNDKRKYQSLVIENIPASYEGGNIYFLFRMKIPKRNEDTGEPEFENERIFTGIYIPTEVTSEFANGTFVQKIKGRRDINIDINFLKNLSF